MWLRSSQREVCARGVRLVLCGSVFVFLNGCASERDLIIDPASSDSDAPVLNGQASHIVQLRGQVSDKYDLRLTAHYTTFNQDCRRTINRFEGVKGQIIVLEELPLAKQANEYRASVQTDKYTPGRCRWSFYQVIYELWPKGTSRATIPLWQWSEWIGNSATGPVIERTVVCAGTESPMQKTRNECNYPGEKQSYFSRPRSVISRAVKSIVVNFE
jgi:hypothetical protein